MTYGGGGGPDAPGGGADPNPVPGGAFRRPQSATAVTIPTMTAITIPANRAYASMGGRPRIVEEPDPLEPDDRWNVIDSGSMAPFTSADPALGCAVYPVTTPTAKE